MPPRHLAVWGRSIVQLTRKWNADLSDGGRGGDESETGEYHRSYHTYHRMIGFWCRLISGARNKYYVTMHRLIKKMHMDPTSILSQNG